LITAYNGVAFAVLASLGSAPRSSSDLARSKRPLMAAISSGVVLSPALA
jgi:hypothetical protein